MFSKNIEPVDFDKLDESIEEERKQEERKKIEKKRKKIQRINKLIFVLDTIDDPKRRKAFIENINLKHKRAWEEVIKKSKEFTKIVVKKVAPFVVTVGISIGGLVLLKEIDRNTNKLMDSSKTSSQGSRESYYAIKYNNATTDEELLSSIKELTKMKNKVKYVNGDSNKIIYAFGDEKEKILDLSEEYNSKGEFAIALYETIGHYKGQSFLSDGDIYYLQMASDIKEALRIVPGELYDAFGYSCNSFQRVKEGNNDRKK